MHPLFLLMAATLVLVIGFLVWNKMSVKRHSFDHDVSGIGGSHDPLSGKNADVRDPAEMNSALRQAADHPEAT